MRNIKILGLALLAMFSMSAVMAVSASADSLKAQAYPAILTGEPDGTFKDVFNTTAGNVSCPEPKYDIEPTLSGPLTTSDKVLATPTYPHTGCTGFGFPATIDHNGCKYEFKILAGTAGTVNLECTSGEITVTAISAGTTKCTVHVKSQTDIPGTIQYSNLAGGAGITLEANLTGIHYTHTQGTGIGACPSGTGTNGTLTAKGILTADKEDGTSTTLTLTNP
jgi:hypothetical protein